MKPIRVLVIAVFFLVPGFLQAQQSQTAESKPAPETTSETPLKLQVVLTEFDGTRKVSSLPYSVNILGTELRDRNTAHLRYGLRVPIGEGASYSYQNIGTNIDCTAIEREDGTYRLDLTVDRSSVSVPGSNGSETEWKPGQSGPTQFPVIRSFRDEFTVVAKLAQTVEATSATDPLTGHVLKVEVTLTEVK